MGGMSGQLVIGDARIICHLLSHHVTEVVGKPRDEQTPQIELSIDSAEAEQLARHQSGELSRGLTVLHHDVTEVGVGLGGNFIRGVDVEKRVDLRV